MHIVVKQISRIFSSCKMNSTPMNLLPLFTSPDFDNHHSTFRFEEFINFTYFYHISEIVQYLSFCDWFISFSIFFPQFINVVVYHRISFFLTFYLHSFSHIILHHVPSQVTWYSSLCYTAGSHCLSIPFGCNSLCLLTPDSQSLLLPPPPPW